jgi:hypothetical protein
MTNPAGANLVDPNLRSIALIPAPRKLRDIILHMQQN